MSSRGRSRTSSRTGSLTDGQTGRMIQTLQAFALLASGSFVYALQPPWYVELPAMGMVGLFLFWLLRRENRTADDAHSRIDDLEGKVDQLQSYADEQRRQKHQYLNRVAVLETLLVLVRRSAEQCTCGSLDHLAPLLEQTKP